MKLKPRIFIKQSVYNFANWYRIINRKKDWKEFATKHTKKCSLTPEQIQQAKDFYAPYYAIEPIFFHFYYEKTGTFDVRFVPDDVYYCYVDPYFNDWDQAIYVDNKCFYPHMFTGVRQPDTVLMRMNNIWFDCDNNIVSGAEAERIMSCESDLFIKIATESDGGQGVYYYAGPNDLSVFQKVTAEVSSDLVIQRGVKQHEELNRMNSSSVNTVRVLSLLEQDGVKIYSSVLRMGVNGNKVDNEASGGRTCGILPDGRLKSVAHDKSGNCYSVHPDSKIPFGTFTVPYYKKVLDVIPTLHKQVPHFRLISWDFSIDQDGEPVLIEANFRYGGVTIHQLNNGPIFGEDTERILREVFRK